MATDNDSGATTDKADVPDPQGHIGFIPYDFRFPTVSKAKSRWWNQRDPRLFTPKVFGAGWDINAYWLAHPAEYAKGLVRR